MADTFGYENAVADPASTAVAVTPNDSTALARTTKALYVGTVGDVAVKMRDSGNTVTFPNVQTGSILPVRVTHVMSTNTTASDIVALS
ncbi:hypothetical protein [Parasphingopyxis sp.]|uniref:spike base protein, RCAP_Rcc01079 family n=1 Tax=Parasphingopyxis sp. TaxID=1920299 RepID=UPI002601DF89|nr:hypothetical protein [Parasphingopyxis sp.]